MLTAMLEERQPEALSGEPAWSIDFTSTEPLHGLALGGAGELLGILVRNRCQLYRVSDETGAADLIVELEFRWADERRHFQKIFFSRDAKKLVIVGGREVLIFNLPTRALFAGTLGYPMCGAWLSPDHKSLAIRQSNSLTIWLVDEDAFRSAGRVESAFSPASPFEAFAFSPDGGRAVLPHLGGGTGFDLIDLSNGVVLRQFDYPCVIAGEPRFSRDGRSLFALVVTDGPFTLVRWDVRSGRVQDTLRVEGAGEGMHDTLLSPFGTYYAGVREADKTIVLTDTGSGWSRTLGRNLGTHLSFNPAETHLVAVEFDSTICVWKLT